MGKKLREREREGVRVKRGGGDVKRDVGWEGCIVIFSLSLLSLSLSLCLSHAQIHRSLFFLCVCV